ncbi:hypothetical protein ABEB36_005943 [Hypothenemus hampei]|uniref:Amidase domain-containing protein n=1 Tax=Hypothenemus hampei TaxID=57062 RepID=A0ABD1F008_HYPHA
MEFLLSIILILTRFFDFITDPIFKYKAKKRQYLPPLKDDDLLRIKASDLAEKIRNQQITCVDVCECYINRIKEVNPYINAVVEDRFKEARREAKLVDGYLRTTSLSLYEVKTFKPLLGVPVTIKESCLVKGLSIAVGLRSRIGFKAEVDGDVVARLKRSGAIVLLVSNVPELVFGWETVNHLIGYTNNPYDTTCTAGGSSGGEGALLGAGASLIGIGSDMAGSIRLPALFNGVFGHKPTPKTVSVKGHWPMCENCKFHEVLVLGPLARFATDLMLMMKVICSDKMCLELKLDETVDLSKLNIFFIEQFDGSITLPKVSEEIQSAVRQAVNYLKKECKASVMDYKFQAFQKSLVICASELYSQKDIPNLLKSNNTNIFIEVIKVIFGKSNFTMNLLFSYITKSFYNCFVGDYSKDNDLMKNEVMAKLGTNGVIIMPTSIGAAHKHNQIYFRLIYPYLILANALGLPSTSVPCGFDKNGMPIGIQVMAAPYQDRLCLAVAEELEKLFGGWVPPPEKS